MATIYWQPKVVAVTQVSTVQITAFDAATTYAVIIGGVTISVAGNTDADTTASDLQVALGASLQPYFSAITWTVATDTITATAKTAGVPFAFTTSETGGTGTIGDQTDTTAATSPHHADNADNWSTGALPGAADDIILRDSNISLLWGLDGLSGAITSITQEASFTGRVGLRADQFATSADSTTTDATVPEYRETYLEASFGTLDIGLQGSPGTPANSDRVRISNTNAGASTCFVHSTGTRNDQFTGNKPVFLYKVTSATAVLEVRRGIVGVARGIPGETSQLSEIRITDTTTQSQVLVGPGTTLATFSQRGGINRISLAATLTTLRTFAGELDVEGADYTITTLDGKGGLIRDKHTQSSGDEWTNIDLDGATLDLTGTDVARTVNDLRPERGTIIARWDLLTVTTFTKPTTLRQVVYSDP